MSKAKEGKAKEGKEKQRGRVVKLSKEVANFLNKKRQGKLSYDAVLRRHFGLPARTGEPQELRTYYILENDSEPLAFLNGAEARGFAITLAIKKKKGRADRAIMVREIP